MVVLGVKVAGNRAALLAWNPEVGASSIENDLEGLRRCTNLNLTEILSIEEVRNSNWMDREKYYKRKK